MLVTTLAFSLATTLAGPQEPRSSEALSLQHLVEPPPPLLAPAWGTLLLAASERPQVNLVEPEYGDQNPNFATDDIVDLMRTWAAPACEEGRVEFRGQGNQLLVLGERAQITAARERLRTFGNRVVRPVQIELCVWDAADREPPATVLAPADWARFAGNREPLWRCVTTTPQGIAAAVEHMRWSRYIGDVDVEIAQKQTMSDPVERAYGEGVEAVVRPFALAGSDDLVLHVQFALAQRRGPVRSVATGVPNSPEIELPTLEAAFGTCSGRIGNGGALAATLRGHASTGAQHIVTIRATATLPVANTHDGTLVLPVGALTSDGLTVPARPYAGFHEELADGEPQPGHDHVDADSLQDLVRNELGADVENLGLRCTRGFLIAHGAPEVLARVEAVVRRLQDDLVRTVTFRHTSVLKASGDDPTAVVPSLQDLTLPTLAGRELTIARGLETPMLAAIQVEIASEAGILDPIVKLAQSGTWLRARVAPFGDAMHLQLTLLDRHVAPPNSRSVMPGGILMPTETWQSRGNHAGPVANGAAVDLGDGPILIAEGRARGSRLAASLRW